jgi:hypothetical protein
VGRKDKIMKKIVELVERDWKVVIISDSQRWYNVEFSHNIWGVGVGYKATLTAAISEAYKEAKRLEGV